jgi:hypothetical protein
MILLDTRIAAVLSAGLLSSVVLLACSTPPLTASIEELWDLSEDADLTTVGSLVSLRVFESGSEVIVLADTMSGRTARVVCTFGPGPPPSARASIGDTVSVHGQCTIEEGAPVVYCRYPDVIVLHQSEEVLTVAVLGTSWQLFIGDTFCIGGIAMLDPDRGPRLVDSEGGCSIEMRLGDMPPVDGRVVVVVTLLLDGSTMALLLDVVRIITTP